MVATVFGSTGFLGRYVVSSIGEAGGRAVCPHRCDDMDMQHLRPMGDLGNIITLDDFSIRDDQKIRDSISKSNVVINLIGQNTETWNYKFKEVRLFSVLCALCSVLQIQSTVFLLCVLHIHSSADSISLCKQPIELQVHEQWPGRLADMCASTPSVERLIHVSALGADPNSASPRLASMGKGEAAIMDSFPEATIMRFGPVVGVEDRFYNDFALWAYSAYGVPVVDGGYARVQPVYCVDAAEAIYKSLQFDDAPGSVYELGGPDSMSCASLFRLSNKECMLVQYRDSCLKKSLHKLAQSTTTL